MSKFILSVRYPILKIKARLIWKLTSPFWDNMHIINYSFNLQAEMGAEHTADYE